MKDRERLLLWASFAALAAFSFFFLIRPFVGSADPYRPRLIPGVTFSYSYLVVAAFIPYAVAAWATRRGVPLRTAAISGAALHLIVLLAPLTQSQDLYAYLFYGKMWAAHGANPYTVLPLAFPNDPWLPWMQWADTPTVYGPLWTMVTGGVARLAGGSLAGGYLAMKAVVLALGVASAVGIAKASGLRDRSPGRDLMLWLWNPLVIVAVSLGGHADIAVAAAVVWALVADRAERPLLATLALTAAWLVKAYAGVVLLVYLIALTRRQLPLALRAAALSAGVTALAWLPFWEGFETLKGLAEIGGRASSSLGGQIQTVLAELFSDELSSTIVRVAGVLVILAVIAIHARGRDFASDPWPGAAGAFLAYAAVTPWFLYWHLIGPLALALVGGSAAVRAATFVFSGTAPLTAGLGGGPWGRLAQTILRYVPPTVAGVIAARPPATTGTPSRSRRLTGSSA